MSYFQKIYPIAFACLFILGCDSAQNESKASKSEAEVAYLNSVGDKPVPIWQFVGARNNDLNNGQPLLEIRESNQPIKVHIVDQQVFSKTGARYYRVKLIDDDQRAKRIEGYVARTYVFSDKNGIFYKDKSLDGGVALNNQYYSREVDWSEVTKPTFLIKALERERRGEFETRADYQLRIEEARNLASQLVAEDAIYYSTEVHNESTYDIDQQTLTIPLIRGLDWTTSRTNVPNIQLDCDYSCDLPLPKSIYTETKHRSVDGNLGIEIASYTPIFRSSGFKLSRGGRSEYSDPKTDAIALVATMNPKKAKEVDPLPKMSVLGLSRLVGGSYDTHEDCFSSSSYPYKESCYYDGNYYIEGVEVPYFFVVTPTGEDLLLGSYFSDKFLKNGIVRDIQIMLSKRGFDTGYPDGQDGPKLSEAINRAVTSGLLKESQVAGGKTRIFAHLLTRQICDANTYNRFCESLSDS